ncbi:MAG: hypothetical protein IJH64_00850 [Oscillospiraceae bacterium]|nr:hypothetical protein [Oscillospiraceae bacterium]
MSKQQWGHGYWKGVQDAQNGDVRCNIEKVSKHWIKWMMQENADAKHSRLLYSVKDFSFWLTCVFGYTPEYVKQIYDYILNNEPDGCYVTGQPFGEWIDDMFVLPPLRRKSNA